MITSCQCSLCVPRRDQIEHISATEFERYQPRSRRRTGLTHFIRNMQIGEAIKLHPHTCNIRNCSQTVTVHKVAKDISGQFETYHREGALHILRVY